MTTATEETIAAWAGYALSDEGDDDQLETRTVSTEEDEEQNEDMGERVYDLRSPVRFVGSRFRDILEGKDVETAGFRRWVVEGVDTPHGTLKDLQGYLLEHGGLEAQRSDDTVYTICPDRYKGRTFAQIVNDPEARGFIDWCLKLTSPGGQLKDFVAYLKSKGLRPRRRFSFLPLLCGCGCGDGWMAGHGYNVDGDYEEYDEEEAEEEREEIEEFGDEQEEEGGEEEKVKVEEVLLKGEEGEDVKTEGVKQEEGGEEGPAAKRRKGGVKKAEGEGVAEVGM